MNRIITQEMIRINLEEIDALYRENDAGKKLILLVTDNTEEAISLYCYHIRKKNTILLLNEQQKIENISDIISRLMPDELYLEDGYFDNDCNNLRSIPKIFREYAIESRYHHYVRYVREFPVFDELHSDVALLMTTSGSLGIGKIVALSYTNLRSNAEAIARALDIQKGERAALMLPMSYVYGLSIINSYLLSGGELLLPPNSMFRKDYWDFLEANRVNSFCGVPYTYEIMDRLKIFHRAWKDLLLITQAGGSMNRKLKEKILTWVESRKHNGKSTRMAIMYGQTEATARMSTFFLDDYPDKFDSVGKAIPGGKFEILSPDANGEGEVIYNGPNVYMGYVKNREELLTDSSVLKNTCRILNTEDIGKIDKEGFLYITGRKKRFVKVNGIRISLDELERQIREEMNIKVVCIHKTTEETIYTYVLKSQTQDKEIISNLENYFSHNRIAKEKYRICQIDAFCYSENGKIDYNAIGAYHS